MRTAGHLALRQLAPCCSNTCRLRQLVNRTVTLPASPRAALPYPWQGLCSSAKISAGPQGGRPHQQAGQRIICVYTDDFADK